MIPLDSVATSPLQQIPAGHLLILRTQSGPVLGIRGAVGNGVVMLPQAGSPVYMDCQANPPCVDLRSKGSACIQSISGSLIAAAEALAPGNLAIVGHSKCIISQLQVGLGGPRLVDIATGAIVTQTDQCWYATNWSLGLYDRQGAFHELFRRP